MSERIHWSFPDPAQAKGSDAEKLAQARAVRDQNHAKIEQWAKSA